MNDLTFKLLEKALQVSPDDWETRAHLIDALLARAQGPRASEILRAAPVIPVGEEAQLLKARVELETDAPGVIATLEGVLSRNKACAAAYLLFARVYFKRGLREEARKKYGAATLLDESISDPELDIFLDRTTDTPAKPARTAERADDSTRNEGEEQDEDGDDTGEEDESSAVAVLSRGTEDTPEIDKDDEMLRQLGAGENARRVTFDDLGGMQEVIERIRMNIVYPFKNPEVFRKFNKRPGGGILMYGPPGCGKTHLARATAGECGANFISIAITDILSKWIGESERHLHEIFELARRHAPTVIFIDEIDGIGMNRSDAGAYQAPVVNVLLTEMDGIQSGNESLMVLAATNVPWRVDGALRRPGRFDRVLFVPPPDLAARRAILDIHLRGLPVGKGLDLDKMARVCERFSGADLRAVVERASEKAIYQEMRTGRATELTQAMLLEALKETKPSTSEWLETARSYATYANKAGLYDELVAFFDR